MFRLDGSQPTRYGLRLDGDTPVSELKRQFAALVSLSLEQIGFFDATSYSLRRNVSMDNDQTRLKLLTLRELLVYELPLTPTSQLPNSPPSYITARHRRLERQERHLSPMTRHRIIFFGQPILVPYQNDSNHKTTNGEIYQNVFKQLERLLRKNTETNIASNHDHSLSERYPFKLKHVQEDGKKCCTCTWNRYEF